MVLANSSNGISCFACTLVLLINSWLLTPSWCQSSETNHSNAPVKCTNCLNIDGHLRLCHGPPLTLGSTSVNRTLWMRSLDDKGCQACPPLASDCRARPLDSSFHVEDQIEPYPSVVKLNRVKKSFYEENPYSRNGYGRIYKKSVDSQLVQLPKSYVVHTDESEEDLVGGQPSQTIKSERFESSNPLGPAGVRYDLQPNVEYMPLAEGRVRSQMVLPSPRLPLMANVYWKRTVFPSKPVLIRPSRKNKKHQVKLQDSSSNNVPATSPSKAVKKYTIVYVKKKKSAVSTSSGDDKSDGLSKQSSGLESNLINLVSGLDNSTDKHRASLLLTQLLIKHLQSTPAPPRSPSHAID